MATQIQQIFNIIHEVDSEEYVNDIIRPFIQENPIFDPENFSSLESQSSVEIQLSTLVISIIQEHLKRINDKKSKQENYEMELQTFQLQNLELKTDILELNSLVSHKEQQIQKLYKGVEESESEIDGLRKEINRLEFDVRDLREKNMKLEMAKEPPSVIERRHTQSLIELERFMNDNDQLEIENMQLKETLYQARVEIAQLSGRNLETINTQWSEEHPSIAESLDKSNSGIQVVKKLSFEVESPDENVGEVTNEDSPGDKILENENEFGADVAEKNVQVETIDLQSNEKESGYEKIIKDSPDGENLTDPSTFNGSSKSTRNNSDSITNAHMEELRAITKQILTFAQTEMVTCEHQIARQEPEKNLGTDEKLQRKNGNILKSSKSSTFWGLILKNWFNILLISIMCYVFFAGDRKELPNSASSHCEVNNFS